MRATRVAVALSLAAGLLSTQSPAEATTCVTSLKGPAFKSTNKTYRHADTWLYGDSITYQSWRYLRPLDGGLAVDAVWGRQTSSAVTNLGRDVHRFPTHLPRTVVIATGTNDLYQLDTFRKQVALARAVLPTKVRLLWVNVYVETTTTYNLADRILGEQAGVRPLLWSRTNLSSDHSLLKDGIHVTNEGCDLRNALIRRAIG